MSKIEFVSHQYFPEDLYTKEAVYLCLEGKYRVLYIRKASKAGGMFWSVPTVAVSRGQGKEFLESFMQDSNFLEKDIRAFLEGRAWENSTSSASAVQSTQKPAASTESWYVPAESTHSDALPF
jgi:hypothetical protein